MGFMAHLYMTLMQHPYDTIWGAFGFLGLVIAWQFFNYVYPRLFDSATRLFYAGVTLP